MEKFENHGEEFDQIRRKDENCEHTRKNSKIKCGFCRCYPEWLQIFASKKSYTVVYSIILVLSSLKNAYTSGTLSTIEKTFKYSANNLGLIQASFEIGSLLTNFSLVYFVGKGNKIVWICFSLLVGAFSSVVTIIPNFITNVKDENISTITAVVGSCHLNNDENFVETEFYIFLFGHFMFGLSSTILKTAAALYLDDNTRKNVFPLAFAIGNAAECVGKFFGYAMASFFLKMYVQPNVRPNFSEKDIEWIGAWWLGWIPIVTIYLLCSVIVILFPRSLPRTVQRRGNHFDEIKPSGNDFIQTVKRISKNKIVMLDLINDVSVKIGYLGYSSFLPKYLETQFGLTASSSSLSLGFIKLLGQPVGIMIAGFSFSRFKPTPRSMIKWNISAKIIQIVFVVSTIFIICPEQKIEQNWIDDFRNSTETCYDVKNCENTKYSPVCDQRRKIYYYSSCHAGCSPSSYVKNLQIYNNCGCVSDFGSVKNGRCPAECYWGSTLYVVFIGFFSCIHLAFRYFKKVMHFRYVDEGDRSLFFGLRKSVILVLGNLPAPILYGTMIDRACLLFEKTCKKTGYCLVYNTSQWKNVINLFTAGFFIVGLVAEMLVWYHVKNLKIYDEDFEKEKLKINSVPNENKILLINSNPKNQI